VKAATQQQARTGDRPVVCVQGLGFVGAAMAAAVADARDPAGAPRFHVIGVDLPTPEGLAKIEVLKAGRFPFACEDERLNRALREAHRRGNLTATADPRAYAAASVILVDVNLDVIQAGAQPTLALEGFQAAIRTLGAHLSPGCLVIVESTVPPGACAKVVAPLLAESLATRGLPRDAFLLAHAYERVMPGREYFASMVDFWRVYAGHTPEAADACEAFLSQVVNVRDYPLTRLPSTTASELAKVLENSYRAVNIAFMEEWGRFAESLGVDIFPVIEAIRKRPTHSNLRQPGFGVGGYCLTKDPLLPEIAAREFFGRVDLAFPFCSLAVAANREMPLVSLHQVQALLGGNLAGKSLLLLGVSYRQDIGDTRHSPAETFVTAARARGARVLCHDPYLDYWPELQEFLHATLPGAADVDAVVFAVPHAAYLDLDLAAWLDGATPLIFDANNVLSREQLQAAQAAGCRVAGIGRGELS